MGLRILRLSAVCIHQVGATYGISVASETKLCYFANSSPDAHTKPKDFHCMFHFVSIFFIALFGIRPTQAQAHTHTQRTAHSTEHTRWLNGTEPNSKRLRRACMRMRRKNFCSINKYWHKFSDSFEFIPNSESNIYMWTEYFNEITCSLHLPNIPICIAFNSTQLVQASLSILIIPLSLLNRWCLYTDTTRRQLHAISFCFYPTIAQPTKRTSEQITNKSMAEHSQQRGAVHCVDASMYYIYIPAKPMTMRSRCTATKTHSLTHLHAENL